MQIKLKYKNKTYRYSIKSEDFISMKKEILDDKDLPKEIKEVIKSSKSLIEMSSDLRDIGVKPSISVHM